MLCPWHVYYYTPSVHVVPMGVSCLIPRFNDGNYFFTIMIQRYLSLLKGQTIFSSCDVAASQERLYSVYTGSLSSRCGCYRYCSCNFTSDCPQHHLLGVPDFFSDFLLRSWCCYRRDFTSRRQSRLPSNFSRVAGCRPHDILIVASKRGYSGSRMPPFC